MTIVTNKNGTRVMTPDEGKYLTNGETYSTKVYLGKNASPDEWREVDEIPAEEDATEADYLEALAELGVTDEES